VAAVSFLGCLEDPFPFFEEAARILVPGGMFVVTHTNRGSILGSISRLFGRDPAGAPVTGTLRSHRGGAIQAKLERAGFVTVERRAYHFVVELGGCSFPGQALARRLDARGTPGWWSGIGRNSLIVARKSGC
jgi:hypothetical protein